MKEILRKMKHEIITLDGVQIIGMAKEIAFCKGQKECPKFWGEYVEKSLPTAVPAVLQGVAAPAPGIPLPQQCHDDGMVQRHRHRVTRLPMRRDDTFV